MATVSPVPPPGTLRGKCKNSSKHFDPRTSKVVYVRMPVAGTLHEFSFETSGEDLVLGIFVIEYHADGHKVRSVLTVDEFEKRSGSAALDRAFELAEDQLDAEGD